MFGQYPQDLQGRLLLRQGQMRDEAHALLLQRRAAVPALGRIKYQLRVQRQDVHQRGQRLKRGCSQIALQLADKSGACAQRLRQCLLRYTQRPSPFVNEFSQRHPNFTSTMQDLLMRSQDLFLHIYIV